MPAATVESTTLTTVAYDPVRQLLRLQFRSRAVYCYFGVPEGVYHSKGSYFNRKIRGRFPYHRLT